MTVPSKTKINETLDGTSASILFPLIKVETTYNSKQQNKNAFSFAATVKLCTVIFATGKRREVAGMGGG